MLHTVGIGLAISAVTLDLTSYIKQIKKTLRVKHSKDVSSSAYVIKIAKILCSTTSLAIFANWIGLTMELSALVACVTTLVVIAKFKPKNWRLFS